MLQLRMMMAANKPKGGGGKWAYELHITADEMSQGVYESYIAGDYTELLSLATEMLLALGHRSDASYNIYDIPEDFDITLNGQRITAITGYLYESNGDSFESIDFKIDSDDCWGYIALTDEYLICYLRLY